MDTAILRKAVCVGADLAGSAVRVALAGVSENALEWSAGHRLAGIANAVAVAVLLSRIRVLGTVIAEVAALVPV